jgi:DNA-binding response OmpR family regulator
MARPIVLLLENEWVLCDALAEALIEAGLRVITCARGCEALVALEREERIDALVADLVLGDEQMSGVEVAARFSNRHPAGAVLYVTGSTSPCMIDGRVVTKPFGMQEVVAALQEMIAGAAEQTPRCGTMAESV